LRRIKQLSNIHETYIIAYNSRLRKPVI